MGYGKNRPDENILKILDDSEKELLKVIEPKYVYKIFDIDDIDPEEGHVLLKGCEMRLEGKDIAAHLKGCRKAVLMACTISSGADRLIRIRQVRDMTEAFVMDSLASSAVEQACDLAQEEIMKLAGKFCTWRFSCGYGDFPIETQKMFVSVLDAQKRIGLNVSNSCMLVPSKSVTAVFGISDTPLEKRRTGCECCNMKDTCNFRKKGERCEF